MICSQQTCGRSNHALELMRFTLTYDGPLPPSGNRPKPKYAWLIRKEIHAQLDALWQSSEVLRRLPHVTKVPTDQGYMHMELHHSHPKDTGNPKLKDEHVDLCAPIDSFGNPVLPLVRDSLATTCGLNILLLRQEEPGNLFSQSGDIDNRVKTLFDGLRAPKYCEEWKGQNDVPNPLYCLLEDDSLITDYSLKTDRLLPSKDTDPKDVRLVIEVKVRASIVKSYNLPLIGD